MRTRDSSLTRVGPVFDQLFRLDPSGEKWIQRLVNLPIYDRGEAVDPVVSGLLQAPHWNSEDGSRKEIRLRAPTGLLRHLVQHPHPGLATGRTAESTCVKRAGLVNGDQAILADALRLLDEADLSKPAWFILEGPTQPDVYLETEDAIVVIEGKRTEAGPTTHTSTMPVRHQMLRHIDCAWEVRGTKRVWGFFIVSGGTTSEDTQVPHKWREAAIQTVSDQAVAESLPHRSTAERTAIASAFLGCTTWQAVCREFSLSWTDLPDRLG